MSKPVDLLTKEGLREYPGVEFKSAGRQVVAPGSRHPDTKDLYKWDITSEVLDEFGADSAPRTLLDDLKKKIATPHISTDEADILLLPQEVEAVLKAIGEIDSYDEWVKILIACHNVSGGMALSECQDWSFESDRENVASKWASFIERGNSGGQVGWGTLKYYAELYGGQNAMQVCDEIERGDPADDFDDFSPDILPDGAKPPTEFRAPEVIWKVRDGILRETADLAELAISQSPKHIYKRGSLLVTPKSADKAGMPTYLRDEDGELVLDENFEPIIRRRLIDYDARIFTKLLDKVLPSADGTAQTNVQINTTVNAMPRKPRLVNATVIEDTEYAAETTENV